MSSDRSSWSSYSTYPPIPVIASTASLCLRAFSTLTAKQLKAMLITKTNVRSAERL